MTRLRSYVSHGYTHYYPLLFPPFILSTLRRADPFERSEKPKGEKRKRNEL
jgi:hypothetical protein